MPGYVGVPDLPVRAGDSGGGAAEPGCMSRSNEPVVVSLEGRDLHCQLGLVVGVDRKTNWCRQGCVPAVVGPRASGVVVHEVATGPGHMRRRLVGIIHVEPLQVDKDVAELTAERRLGGDPHGDVLPVVAPSGRGIHVGVEAPAIS